MYRFLKESFTLVLGAETVSHEAILFDVVVVVAGSAQVCGTISSGSLQPHRVFRRIERQR
jgi:hypothetical protein